MNEDMKIDLVRCWVQVHQYSLTSSEALTWVGRLLYLVRTLDRCLVRGPDGRFGKQAKP